MLNDLLGGWKLVATDGNPDDGLYVALYEDGQNVPVGLCSYGDWEFFDADDLRDDADDDGIVRGHGWTESSTDLHGDGYVHLRSVVAYLPINFAHSQPDMAAIRALLTPNDQLQPERTK
jgi:hypothetical protein